MQTNLVSNLAGQAAVTDKNLVNAWGIAFSPSGPFWISDNGTGLATTYNGPGTNEGLTVTIPKAGGGSGGPVSGQVYNSTSGFTIPGGSHAIFIFDGEDGLITAWSGGTSASVAYDHSATGAVYKGLAIASNGGANFLYATNFNSGMVDMYDTNFALAGSFTDPNIPSGFAPFGIQNIGGKLYVTFAKQDAAKHDDVKGAGNGYVDVFNPDGSVSARLISQGVLNSPWGLAVAPSSFGTFAGDLLVGNFGDGRINVFSLSGTSLGTLNSSSGPIAIDGLWGLAVGNGGSAGSSTSVYFTAGPNSEGNGLLGSLSSAP